MSLITILEKVDKRICNFLSYKETIFAEQVIVKGNCINITNTIASQRHIHEDSIQLFLKNKVNNVSKDNLQKLGVAVGKALADNLVINFIKEKKL